MEFEKFFRGLLDTYTLMLRESDEWDNVSDAQEICEADQ